MNLLSSNRAFAAILIGVIGLLLNTFPVRLGYGLDLLPGVMAGYLALIVLGLPYAIVSAALPGLASVWLWSNPWAGAIIVLEVVFVGLLLRTYRVHLTLAVVVYWLTVGLALWALLNAVMMRLDAVALLLIVIKQALNGLVAAATAALLVLAVTKGWRWLRPQMRPFIYSLHAVMLNVLVVLVLLPLLIFVLIHGREDRADIDERVRVVLDHSMEMVESEFGEVLMRERDRLERLRALVADIPAANLYPAVMARSGNGLLLQTDDQAYSGIAKWDGENVVFNHALGPHAAPTGLQRILERSSPLALDSNVALALSEEQAGLPDAEVAVLLLTRAKTQDGSAIVIYRVLPVSWIKHRLSYAPLTQGVTLFAQVGARRVALRHEGEQLPPESAAHDALNPVIWPNVYQQWPAEVPSPSAMHQWAGATLWSSRELNEIVGARLIVGYKPDREIAVYRQRLLDRLGMLGGIALIGLVVAFRLSSALTSAISRTADGVQQMSNSFDVPRIHSRLLEPDTVNMALRRLAIAIARERARVEQYAKRLEELVNNAPVVIWSGVIDARKKIRTNFISRSLQSLTGHTEIPDYAGWAALIHPSDRDLARKMFDKLVDHGYSSGEYRIRKADGEYLWVYGETTVLDSENGGGNEVVGLWVDITKLKEGQAQLVQTAKMATLGEMATGVAHELNQPLQVIQLAADNALEELDEDHSSETVAYVRARLERVIDQAERAAGIIDQMRMFGRRRDESASPVSLADVIESVLALIGQQLRSRGITVSVHDRSAGARVLARSHLLEQVVLNIVNNARDAICARVDGASVTSGLIDVTIDVEANAAREKALILTVEDNGGGIPADLVEHVFEPFFTTKPVGQGTGLGLSISYGIIRDMGGSLACGNGASGAIFRICLPVVDDESSKDQP